MLLKSSNYYSKQIVESYRITTSRGPTATWWTTQMYSIINKRLAIMHHFFWNANDKNNSRKVARSSCSVDNVIYIMLKYIKSLGERDTESKGRVVPLQFRVLGENFHKCFYKWMEHGENVLYFLYKATRTKQV